jgi:hypothetical protein
MVVETVPVIVVEAKDTGCVACQNVPLTGWVACQKVPVTAIVWAAEIPTVHVPLCVAAMVPDMGTVPEIDTVPLMG